MIGCRIILSFLITGAEYSTVWMHYHLFKYMLRICFIYLHCFTIRINVVNILYNIFVHLCKNFCMIDPKKKIVRSKVYTV